MRPHNLGPGFRGPRRLLVGGWGMAWGGEVGGFLEAEG